MIEQRSPPYKAPRVVNTLYTPSTYQYVYFQGFNNKHVEFRVRASAHVHVLFTGKEIGKELVIYGTDGVSAIRSSKQGSVIASTDTLKLLSSEENHIQITWNAEARTFKVTVNGTEWVARLPAGNRMNPFTKVSFSTSADVTGMFMLNESGMGTDYGYGDYIVPKPEPEPVAPEPQPEPEPEQPEPEEVVAPEPEPEVEPPPKKKSRGRKKKSST